MREPKSVRRTLQALHAEGRPTPQGFMENRPEVPNFAADIYEVYHYLTPDFNGNLTGPDMGYWLDQMGITGFSERAEIMMLWRKMHSEHRPKTDDSEDDSEVPDG